MWIIYEGQKLSPITPEYTEDNFTKEHLIEAASVIEIFDGTVIASLVFLIFFCFVLCCHVFFVPLFVWRLSRSRQNRTVTHRGSRLEAVVMAIGPIGRYFWIKFVLMQMVEIFFYTIRLCESGGWNILTWSIADVKSEAIIILQVVAIFLDVVATIVGLLTYSSFIAVMLPVVVDLTLVVGNVAAVGDLIDKQTWYVLRSENAASFIGMIFPIAASVGHIVLLDAIIVGGLINPRRYRRSSNLHQVWPVVPHPHTPTAGSAQLNFENAGKMAKNVMRFVSLLAFASCAILFSFVLRRISTNCDIDDPHLQCKWVVHPIFEVRLSLLILHGCSVLFCLSCSLHRATVKCCSLKQTRKTARQLCQQ
jgi:hypothetical protein